MKFVLFKFKVNLCTSNNLFCFEGMICHDTSTISNGLTTTWQHEIRIWRSEICKMYGPWYILSACHYKTSWIYWWATLHITFTCTI